LDQFMVGPVSPVVFRHRSPITNHRSPITNHQSLITNHLSHALRCYPV
jgi:hypothetical protein